MLSEYASSAFLFLNRRGSRSLPPFTRRSLSRRGVGLTCQVDNWRIAACNSHLNLHPSAGPGGGKSSVIAIVLGLVKDTFSSGPARCVRGLGW